MHHSLPPLSAGPGGQTCVPLLFEAASVPLDRAPASLNGDPKPSLYSEPPGLLPPCRGKGTGGAAKVKPVSRHPGFSSDHQEQAQGAQYKEHGKLPPDKFTPTSSTMDEATFFTSQTLTSSLFGQILFSKSKEVCPFFVQTAARGYQDPSLDPVPPFILCT